MINIGLTNHFLVGFLATFFTTFLTAGFLATAFFGLAAAFFVAFLGVVAAAGVATAGAGATAGVAATGAGAGASTTFLVVFLTCFVASTISCIYHLVLLPSCLLCFL